MKKAGVKQNDSDFSTSSSIHPREYAKVRALFRSKGYFSQPQKVNLLKSVTREALNQELISLTTLATDLEEVYLNTFVENPAKKQCCSREKFRMLYVTELEKEKYEATENLTKAQLKTVILDVILKLPENEAKIMQDHFERSINSKNKEDYL